MASPPSRPGQRSRALPPPIRTASGGSALIGSNLPSASYQSPTKLLYELPPSTSRSPPPSASKFRSRSPPYSPPPGERRRTSFGAALQTKPTQPTIDGQDVTIASPTKSRRGSNHDLLEPKKSDLDAFAELCRRWYYEQDSVSGRSMSQTLANIAPAHRATYTRLQASIRSAFHSDQSIRRISEFRALLSSTEPGNSLTPAARAAPSGSLARAERLEKFHRFVRSQCLSSVPGTHPFFEGLYGALRLQSLPEKLGGASGRLIEWEIDDAVFIESAGKDFTMEAVDTLKGVLGFRESLGEFNNNMPSSTSRATEDFSDEEDGMDFGSLPAPTRMRRMSPPNLSLADQKSSASERFKLSRSRASSDPFLDPSRSYTSTLNASTTSEATNEVESAGPPTPLEDTNGTNIFVTRRDRTKANPGDVTPQTLLEPQLRTWVFPPTLSNPEIHHLLSAFPSFITQRNFARFPVTKISNPTPRQLEEGSLAAPSSPPEIRVGTGKMRIGEQPRVDGWRGGLWTRFREWILSLFR